MKLGAVKLLSDFKAVKICRIISQTKKCFMLIPHIITLWVRDVKEEIFNWWHRRNSVLRFLIGVGFTSVIFNWISFYSQPLLPSFSKLIYEQFQTSGTLSLLLIMLVTFIGIMTYFKLNELSVTSKRIGIKLGITSRKVSSPGVVFTDCKWLVLSRRIETNL